MRNSRSASPLASALLALSVFAWSAQPLHSAPPTDPPADAPTDAPAQDTPAVKPAKTPKAPKQNKGGKPAKAKEVAVVAEFEYAVFHTSQGDIIVELNRAKAPVTVENFTTYIKEGFYDGTVFHRVMPGFVIQGGGFTPKGDQKKTKSAITNEWQNGLKNKRGTLSMARTEDPNSATSQFFVSLKDNDSLDLPISGGAGYAVYGKVIAGMEVVDAIAATPRGVKNGMKDWPTSDITVTKSEMLSKADAEKLAPGSLSTTQATPPTTEPAAAAAPATPAEPAQPKA